MAGDLEITVAKRAGFCFGVKRAVDLAFQTAKKGRHVYTLGPIIHNPQVIDQLQRQGVCPVDSPDDPRIGTIIIRTHGVPREVSDDLSARGLTVIDATCPFVKKAQQYTRLLTEEGYQVVIIGDREHPEVQGLISYAGNNVIVVNTNDPVPRLKGKVGVVVQTTQPPGVLRNFVSAVVGQVKELKVYNTICNSTALRLKETEKMAKKADVMIVVGGRNSANTAQLAQLCRSLSIPTHHIETSSEIRDDWFHGKRKIAITAGASTPEWIIKDVKERISHRGGKG